MEVEEAEARDVPCGNQIGNVRAGNGLPEQKALAQITSLAAQEGRLNRCFHAFGDRGDPEIAAEIEGKIRQNAGLLIAELQGNDDVGASEDAA